MCTNGHTALSSHSATQKKLLSYSKVKSKVGAREMSRLSFALLIVAALMLTAYFGAVAWRMSDDSHTDVTGQIMPRAK
jgi:hypothetical protein